MKRSCFYQFHNFVESSLTNSKYFLVEGTYQHATSNLTLSASKQYVFDATGLGGVLLFNSNSTRDKYDKTAGLFVQFQF